MAERATRDEAAAALPDESPELPASTQQPAGLFQVRKTFSALSVPAYKVFWCSTIFSLMGMQMQMVARGILAYEVGGTNSAIAVVSLGWGIPMALFSLVGGTFADRFNRRKVIMTSQVCTAFVALSIAVLVQTGVINLWLLFLFGLIQGTVFSFGGPARQSFIPEIVGEKHLMNAVALNQAGMNLTRIVGPSIAGAMAAIAWIDLEGVFFTQAVLNGVALILLAMLPLFQKAAPEATETDEARTPRRLGRRPQGSIREEALNGLHYIMASPILLTLLVMGLVPSLLALPYQTFLPVFAKDVFGDGVNRNSEDLGLMMTMTGIGALVGSLVVAMMADYPRRTLLQLVSGLGFGLSLALFAVQSNLIVALAALTALGFAATAFQALNATMIMSSSDPQYYGRVMSINMMTFALMPLGAIPIGLLADLFGTVSIAGLELAGVQVVLLGAGLLVAVFIVAVSIKQPAYRQLEVDDFKHFAEVAADRVREDDGKGGSTWNQIGRAMRQERGSHMTGKADAVVSRVD
jgi:MFS family permease